MAKVEFSLFAKQDLENIIIYVAEHNLASAQKLVKELHQKFGLLAENPKLGVSRKNYIVGMRSFPYKNYFIFYFPIEKGVKSMVFYTPQGMLALFLKIFLKD